MSEQRVYRVTTHTLGCKVNQVDTSAIVRDFAEYGFVPTDENADADVIVVNSCTVTAGADRDARKLIARAREENAGALLVLTGCLSPGKTSGQDRADIVLGNDGKGRLVEDVLTRLNLRDELTRKTGHDGFFGGGVVDTSSRARAFVKVQDGCNRNCAYCVIPSVRGRSRSRAIREIVEDAKVVAARGYHELVLTGVHLGSFGADFSPRARLTDLLTALLNGTNIPRIRISSIEPMEIRDDLIDLMASNPRICPHLHVPLQSGDDDVLRLMRRPYSRDHYRAKIEAIVASVPDVLIGSDVIVGFPGEDESAFENSMDLVERTPLHHLHVFPYSERPGTHAATLTEKSQTARIRARSERLRALGRDKWRRFLGRHIGRTLPVLAIKPVGENTFEGLTANYLPVLVSGPCVSGRECLAHVRAVEDTSKGGRLIADREVDPTIWNDGDISPYIPFGILRA
ncbi:MAG: tRNA (N(6)-L-threonylcarbamoyladenosine(37)-C(2))-methylthiotransferase MtaB [Deltaproteobacteria bacterium]|nr:tRNA (N(6)-L-threonylcarbamoyladenosine(37)-C(2))-methylthiotransferase MtaB [Deltaproteobacteria bacterium]